MVDKVFFAEGNGGGDEIQIKNLGDGRLHLKVGHSCVYTIDAIVPVEFVTTALTRIVDDFNGINGFIKQLDWRDEFKRQLLEAVCTEGCDNG